MDFELLKDGALIMIIGMGTVYFFLTVMIFVMEFNTKILKFVNRFMPEEIEVAPTANKRAVKASDDAEIALAVACALKRGA